MLSFVVYIQGIGQNFGMNPIALKCWLLHERPLSPNHGSHCWSTEWEGGGNYKVIADFFFFFSFYAIVKILAALHYPI